MDKYLKDNYPEKKVGQHYLAGALNKAADLSQHSENLSGLWG